LLDSGGATCNFSWSLFLVTVLLRAFDIGRLYVADPLNSRYPSRTSPRPSHHETTETESRLQRKTQDYDGPGAVLDGGRVSQPNRRISLGHRRRRITNAVARRRRPRVGDPVVVACAVRLRSASQSNAAATSLRRPPERSRLASVALTTRGLLRRWLTASLRLDINGSVIRGGDSGDEDAGSARSMALAAKKTPSTRKPSRLS
jgi:hypothetical protein